MKGKKVLGRFGEKEAIEYLKSQGYCIIEKNFRCKQGEIDIIAVDENTLVFVEVKTRSSDSFGCPSESVNFYKQKKIVKTALTYITNKDLFDWMCRFDVVEVITEGNYRVVKINLIKNAFEYSGKYGY